MNEIDKTKNQKDKNDENDEKIQGCTACVVFPDGHCVWGNGFGNEGIHVAEICFNTSMTGYQEIMTDLSYAGQIVNFTFPHIGNTGTNKKDNESNSTVALGMLTRNMPTMTSHWQSDDTLENWLKKNKIIGIGNIDTRKITRIIRSNGAKQVAICHSKSGNFDVNKLKNLAKNSIGLEGRELTASVTCKKKFVWTNTSKYQTNKTNKKKDEQKVKIIAIDFGAKWSIFDRLTNSNQSVQVMPANSSFDSILELKPDGIFLSNGPGDPFATFNIFGETILNLLKETDLPIFGICLGHQILGLAAGAKTIKMSYGHHGANHPVLDLKSGKVDITSMNHGFAIDKHSLPKGVNESHISLFDGSNCGIEIGKRNSFSVQYHPEASPGPKDSYYLFEKFFKNIRTVNVNKKKF